jgi:hypothetical protein
VVVGTPGEERPNDGEPAAVRGEANLEKRAALDGEGEGGDGGAEDGTESVWILRD